jgi:hypothetical protein
MHHTGAFVDVPLDGGMRQKKIGNWPAMSAPAAIAAWEKLREVRLGGTDPVTRAARDPSLALPGSMRWMRAVCRKTRLTGGGN